jgi:RNA polymerase sigma factor (sigma-70 family)
MWLSRAIIRGNVIWPRVRTGRVAYLAALALGGPCLAVYMSRGGHDSNSSQSVSVGRSVQVLPAPAGRIRQDLAGLDDRDLLGITGSLPRSSERRAAACELLVSRHRDVVWSCVRQYKRSPEPTEDLMQVGYVGLLKAINNFDPAFGCSLAAYARPCITGEIKRHFRDKRWQVHVERSLQELVLEIREATRRLIQQLGHMPANAELASYLGVSDAESGTPGGRNWCSSQGRWMSRRRVRTNVGLACRFLLTVTV